MEGGMEGGRQGGRGERLNVRLTSNSRIKLT